MQTVTPSQIVQMTTPFAPTKVADTDKSKDKGFVFFDIGGVLVDIDLESYSNEIANLKHPNEARDIREITQTIRTLPELLALEQGEIGPFVCAQALIKTLGYSDSDVAQGRAPNLWEIKSLVNAIIRNPRPQVFALTKALRAHGWGVGLLSNTTPWHEAVLERICQISVSFDLVILSHDVGARKPAPAIYAAAEAAAHHWGTKRGRRLTPTDLYFVDDLPENVVAAQSRGWNARLVLLTRDCRPGQDVDTDHWLLPQTTRDQVIGDEASQRVRWLFSQWLEG